MEYKVLTTDKGTRWMKNGKFISEDKVPLSEKKLITGECQFCNQPGTDEKTLNGRRYLLCLDDYNQKTTGELAQTIGVADN